jgi:hypothetical protein
MISSLKQPLQYNHEAMKKPPSVSLCLRGGCFLRGGERRRFRTLPSSFRSYGLQLAAFVLLAFLPMTAQQDKAPAPVPGSEYSGMYSFLRDGEFVQVTVEDQGRVTGFVSRYGDLESDRGAFLDHFFKQGKLEGNKLTFTTETVHGIWFEFRGTVERGEGKKVGDEAYYVLKGTLNENSTDFAKKTSSRSREVALKSFPQDMNPPHGERK